MLAQSQFMRFQLRSRIVVFGTLGGTGDVVEGPFRFAVRGGNQAARFLSFRFDRPAPIFSADENFCFLAKIRAAEDVPLSSSSNRSGPSWPRWLPLAVIAGPSVKLGRRPIALEGMAGGIDAIPASLADYLAELECAWRTVYTPDQIEQIEVMAGSMDLKLHFPPATLAAVKPGDKITLHLAFSKP